MNKDIMKALGFGDYVTKVELGRCPLCDEPICMEDFEDELSRKEFTISGLCQECQNEAFGIDNDCEGCEDCDGDSWLDR